MTAREQMTKLAVPVAIFAVLALAPFWMHYVGGYTALGTRVLVFDKVRADSQAPEAFGATITFNIPLKGHRSPG